MGYTYSFTVPTMNHYCGSYEKKFNISFNQCNSTINIYNYNIINQLFIGG